MHSTITQWHNIELTFSTYCKFIFSAVSVDLITERAALLKWHTLLLAKFLHQSLVVLSNQIFLTIKVSCYFYFPLVWKTYHKSNFSTILFCFFLLYHFTCKIPPKFCENNQIAYYYKFQLKSTMVLSYLRFYLLQPNFLWF